jgi:uncharacterized protein involved in type VI secretion and phage assembly
MSCDTISEALGNQGNQGDQLNNSEIMNGVVPAIVSNLKDPEQLGRIKVTFPWLAKESETDWIRVMSSYASGNKGIFFPPEVGDEVLVVFQKGNVNAPYVIGSLWSSKAKPPDKNDGGKNNVKIIKTRAGHTITFNDEKKKAKIEIKSNAGNTVTLDDASGKEKIEIKDKGGGKIIMDASKKAITIQAGSKLEIKANDITINATKSLTLKTTMLKAKASGQAEIKGSMVKIN